MPTGKVKFFKQESGYGFIGRDDGGDDVFFHITSISDDDKEIRKNEMVEFDVEQGRRGLQAAHVRRKRA